MTEQRQAPPVSPDLDLRAMAFMPLDVARLRDSDVAHQESGEAFRAAVLLWCVAWHQVPAASLPADDASLAKYAGFGRDLKSWRKVKEGALHGFVECSDGRLYHPSSLKRRTRRKPNGKRIGNVHAARRRRDGNVTM